MHYQREVCLPLGHEKRSGATTHDLSDIEHGYTVSGIPGTTSTPLTLRTLVCSELSPHARSPLGKGEIRWFVADDASLKNLAWAVKRHQGEALRFPDIARTFCNAWYNTRQDVVIGQTGEQRVSVPSGGTVTLLHYIHAMYCQKTVATLHVLL